MHLRPGPTVRSGDRRAPRLGVVAVTHDHGVERGSIRRSVFVHLRARFVRDTRGLGLDQPPRTPPFEVDVLRGGGGRRLDWSHRDDARVQADDVPDPVVVGVRVEVRANLRVPGKAPDVVREGAREREAGEAHHLAGQIRAQARVHAAVHSLGSVRVRARQVILHVRVVHPHAPQLGALLEDHRVVALERELARGGEAGGARADHGDARGRRPAVSDHAGRAVSFAVERVATKLVKGGDELGVRTERRVATVHA